MSEALKRPPKPELATKAFVMQEIARQLKPIVEQMATQNWVNLTISGVVCRLLNDLPKKVAKAIAQETGDPDLADRVRVNLKSQFTPELEKHREEFQKLKEL